MSFCNDASCLSHGAGSPGCACASVCTPASPSCSPWSACTPTALSNAGLDRGDMIFATAMDNILKKLTQLDNSTRTVNSTLANGTGVNVRTDHVGTPCPGDSANNNPGTAVFGVNAAAIKLAEDEAIINLLILANTYNRIAPVNANIKGRYCQCVTNQCINRAAVWCRCATVCSCNQVCSPCSPCACNIN